jgi:serine/threonine-protein kinase
MGNQASKAARNDPGSPSENEVVDGRYVIEEPLAMGGMAELYRARRIDGGGQVVIKVMLPQYAEHPEMLRLFDSEAEVAASFRHPNIPRVVDRGHVGGRRYIAFEFVEGVCLAELVDAASSSGRRMPMEVAVGITLQLLDALSHVHTGPPAQAEGEVSPGGVVHRDVTPYNLIVGRDGGVRLIDFGLAESTRPHSDRPRESSVRGTYAYMAPEQVVGGRCDLRSDLFSVGIIAYELTTGARLFQGSAPAIMHMIVEDPIVSPRVKRPDYPAALERIVLRALARDPDSRPGSAHELGGELRRWLEQARPDDPEAGGRVAVRSFVERTLGIPGLLPGGTLEAAGLPRPGAAAASPDTGDGDDLLGGEEPAANEEGIEPDSGMAGPSPEDLMKARLDGVHGDAAPGEGTGYSGRDARLPSAPSDPWGSDGDEEGNSQEAQQLADEIIGTAWATADRIKTAPLRRRSDIAGLVAEHRAGRARAAAAQAASAEPAPLGMQPMPTPGGPPKPAAAPAAAPSPAPAAVAAAPAASPAPAPAPSAVPASGTSPAGAAAPDSPVEIPGASPGLWLVVITLLLALGAVGAWYVFLR